MNNPGRKSSQPNLQRSIPHNVKKKRKYSIQLKFTTSGIRSKITKDTKNQKNEKKNESTEKDLEMKQMIQQRL